MASLSIFGVTGSIGKQAVKLWQENPKAYEIDTITAQSNTADLITLAKFTKAKHVVIGDDDQIQALKTALPGVLVASGKGAIEEAAKRPVDICLNAIIGAAGLPVSMNSAGNAKRLALANKESLVCAGGLLREACEKAGTTILPVDSEHSAIFQCLEGQDSASVARLIITASGGPFRTWSREQMKSAKLKDALNHPNWDMGARITIDSASMFNKALEMIEAQMLFDVSPENIEALIHPQSIIHSLVEFHDGAMLAQLGVPDMRQAIGYALTYPDRGDCGVERLNLAQIGKLDFEDADEVKFKPIRLAKLAMEMGGVSGAVLNGAKEVALDHFMRDAIGFLDMADIVEEVLLGGDWKTRPADLSEVLSADESARQRAQALIARKFL